ncbi:hypothetical protein FRC08_004875, partial [Ceratobasidium sp. 394]
GIVLIFLSFINVTQEWPKDRYAWGSVLSRFINGFILLSLLFLNIGSGTYLMDTSSTGIWAWLDSYWTLPTLALSLFLQTVIDHILLVLSVWSADRELERTYEPSLLDPLRDSKDNAYDPPTSAYPYSTTPAKAEFTTSPTQPQSQQQQNWQPAYVSQTQTPAPQYSAQHQTSYGFVAPPPPPPFMGSGGSAIPPGGIVTPSR